MGYSLNELLTSETIQVSDTLESWEDAVKQGSIPLVEAGKIEKKYVYAMINSVSEHGAYMVLADNFALMHARPEDGVNDTSMAIMLSKKILEMAGKDVRLFLILAAKDNNSHLEGLASITEILSNEGTLEELINAKNKEEILEILERGV